MKDGPDIALLAALIGDPGRANMLVALSDGRALTAGELAGVAGVSLPTASEHLSRMVGAGLLSVAKQGRHRYFRLAGEDVGQALEALMSLAEARGHHRVRTGPRDAAMREARSCYKHLAGGMAVRMYDSLRERGMLVLAEDGLVLSAQGRAALEDMGVAVPQLRRGPICRECLDWSERRMHLAGPLGTALLDHVLSVGWADRVPGSRVIRFRPAGRAALAAAFPLREGVSVGE
ncbi:ArsR/SmtB family transcription factor [Pseudooceanicola sp.]|uniref:ArsR/SmtB family transcription factor n=1 Tax=Pseudooceanicola sp. TaxID=1914328 RepID=UPI0035C70EE4